MLSGLMIHKAAVQRSTFGATTFSSGGTKAWATVNASLPCRIQPLSASERIEFSRPQQEVTHRMYVAGSVDITAADRISFGGRTFNIVGVRNIDEWNRLTTIDLFELSGVDAS